MVKSGCMWLIRGFKISEVEPVAVDVPWSIVCALALGQKAGVSGMLIPGGKKGELFRRGGAV